MKNICLLFVLFSALLTGQVAQAQPGVPNYVAQSGLVGWWPFSRNADDQSGKNNHGTVNGATLTTDRDGNLNAAYAFNGYSNSIEVLDAASLRVRALTMSVWVYSSNLNPKLYDAAIYKGTQNDASSEGYSLTMEMSSAVKIGSGCQSGNGWKRANFGPHRVPRNTWTHLCTTFDGSYLRNYVNSVEVTLLHATGVIDSCAGGNLRFGYAHDLFGALWSWPFLGKLDDIGIWNRALFPGEITELYRGKAQVAPLDTIVNNPNGISGAALPKIHLWPNPAREFFSLTGPRSGPPLQVAITDLMGRMVLQDTFTGGEKAVSLNGLAGGFYLVTVLDAHGTVQLREKLIIE